MIGLLAGTFGQRSTCGYVNVLTAHIRSDICGDDLAVIGRTVLSVDDDSTIQEVGDVHSQRAGEQQQVGIPGIGHRVLVPLDRPPLDPHTVG